MGYLLKNPHERSLECLIILLQSIADHVELNLNRNLDLYFKKYQEAYDMAEKSDNVNTAAQEMLLNAIENRKSNSSKSIQSISTDKKNAKIQATQTTQMIDDLKERQETGENFISKSTMFIIKMF